MCLVPQYQQMGLDEYTTQELISAVMARPTFAGMMIFSRDNHKFPTQHHPNFEMTTTLDEKSTIMILQKMIGAVRDQATEG